VEWIDSEPKEIDADQLTSNLPRSPLLIVWGAAVPFCPLSSYADPVWHVKEHTVHSNIKKWLEHFNITKLNTPSSLFQWLSSTGPTGYIYHLYSYKCVTCQKINSMYNHVLESLRSIPPGVQGSRISKWI